MLIDLKKCVGKNVKISSEFSKSKLPALLWKYSSGETVVLHDEVGYVKEKSEYDEQQEMAFSCYVGSKIGAEGYLKIAFRKCEKVCCSFILHLGFTGWRYVRILFSQMDGIPEENMDNICITTYGNGEITFDEMVVNFVDSRMVSPSYQLPYIGEGIRLPLRLKEKYKATKFDDTIIKKRLFEYVRAEFGANPDRKDIEDRFEALAIKSPSDGKRIEVGQQRRMLKNTPHERAEYIPVRKCGVLARDLAALYHESGEDVFREKYILLIKYLIFNGICEGAIPSVRHLLDYELRELHMSFLLMEKELTDAGLKDEIQRLCQWFADMERKGIYEGNDFKYTTADDFNNLAIAFAAAAVFVEDKTERSRLFFALKDWLDKSMQYTPGLTGLYKPDGSIFHHCGHYIGYGMPALDGVTPIIWALSGTPYEISERSWENTKNAAKMLRFSCSKYDVPVAFSGRHPRGSLKLSMRLYKYLALSGLERGEDEMAAIYLRLMNKPQDALDERIFSQHINAEEEPQGNVAMNMACAMLHRKNGVLVLMKGFSKYLWGNESYPGFNMYGRYGSYGKVEILEGSHAESGFSHNGFDFRRFGGITAIIPPMNEFKQDIKHLDKYSGFEEMLISDQEFAGGISDGENGMFSMILTEHPKYNGTHFCIKSGFFKDDFILLIGSNITNESPYPTETVLFQNCISEDKADDRLTDVLGNIYYVKEGQKICVHHGVQRYEASNGKEELEGYFKYASICHGVSPKNEKYEYAIGLKGAACKPYEVIRCDDVAHIAKIEDITFIAIYKPEEFSYGEIRSVSIPVLIMLEDSGKIRICNPDLGLYDYDESQYDENGNRIEVSIYSREWLENPVASKKCRLVTNQNTYEIELCGGKTYTIN